MDTKKFILGSLGAAITSFLLGGLWHMILMGDFYTAHMATILRPEPSIPFIGLGYLVLGMLMAYTYPLGYKGGSAVKEGFRFGALIGLIWILPLSLMLHGTINISLVVVLVDAGWHIVQEGLAGIVLAFIYGSGAAATSE